MSDRTYARQTREAAALLGSLIALARKNRKLTTIEVAGRAGISRLTLRKIEQGDLKCAIGLVLEVATIVGVPLLASDDRPLRAELGHAKDKLSLLPKHVRRPSRQVRDDF